MAPAFATVVPTATPPGRRASHRTGAGNCRELSEERLSFGDGGCEKRPRAGKEFLPGGKRRISGGNDLSGLSYSFPLPRWLTSSSPGSPNEYSVPTRLLGKYPSFG